MGKATYKVKGGKMIKVNLTLNEGRIEEIKIMGDFFLHPEETIEDIERTLRGCILNEKRIGGLIRDALSRRGAVLLGASPEDLARCIMMAGEENG